MFVLRTSGFLLSNLPSQFRNDETLAVTVPYQTSFLIVLQPKCCTSTNVRLALWINCDERHANPPIIITIDQVNN
jgi:hypothetical protein